MTTLKVLAVLVVFVAATAVGAWIATAVRNNHWRAKWESRERQWIAAFAKAQAEQIDQTAELQAKAAQQAEAHENEKSRYRKDAAEYEKRIRTLKARGNDHPFLVDDELREAIAAAAGHPVRGD